MAAKIEGAGGTTASFSNTPQAGDDYFALTEDTLGLFVADSSHTSVFKLDVMGNDQGGASKTLYSIDDGDTSQLGYTSAKNAPPAPLDLTQADTLNSSGVSAWEASGTDGILIRINNGKVDVDITGYLASHGWSSIDAMPQGVTISESFTYAIKLGNGTLSWATASFTITGVNDKAVITGAKSGHANEAGGTDNGTPGTNATGDLNSTDVDGTDDAWQPVNTPAASNSGYGTFTIDATGHWTYVINQGNSTVQALKATDTLTDTFTVFTQDGTAQKVTVTIHGANDAPALTGTQASLVGGTEDQTYSISKADLLAGYTDVEGDTLAVSGLTANSGTLLDNGDGTWTFTPNANFNGTVTLNYTVIDGHGGSVGATQTFGVAAVEDEATGTLAVDGQPQEGGTLIANLSDLNDVDGPASVTGYQWQEKIGDVWTNIAGQSAQSLNIPDDQSYVGKEVRVIVTTTDSLGGTTTFTSAPQAIANVDDAATGVLGTSGTPEEGGTLTADVSGLGDVDGGIVSYAYQWQLDGIDISGATDASLAIPDDQSYVGHNVGLVVTTTDGLGGTTTFTSAPQAIANVDDAATGVLGTSGTPEEGGTLTADVSGLGDVDGGIVSYAYQWQLDGIDISGATDASLAIPDDQSYVGHNVGLVVTTTDGLGGTTTFTSAPQAIANVDDAATGVLGTLGTPEEGGTLTADVSGLGDVDGGIVSYAYQWQLDGIDIAGATDASLAIPDDQSYVGHNVGLVVTTTDGLGGTTTFTSAPQAIANVDDAATGVLGTSGTPEEGGTLTADVSGLGDVDGGIVSYAYQWQLDGIDISGATDASLAIPDDQSYVGHNVGLVVTTTDGLGGTTTFTSAPQAIANVDDAATGVLGTSGTPEEGGTLTADVSGLGDVDGGIVSYAYQWQLDGIDISGATDASLAIPDDQSYVGHNVGLVVTTTDGLGGTTTFTSAPQAIANVDDAATGVLGTLGTPEEGGTLTADVSGLGDVDGGIVSYAYQWQLDGIDIAGATDASLAIPDDQSYVGHNVGLVVTTTDGLGGTTTFTSAPQAIANVDDAATGVLGTSGTPEEGGTLTADVSGLGDVDGGIVSYAYQWQLDGIDIAGATDASLAIPDDQSYVGHNVGLVVTTTDGLGGTTTFTSAPQAIANVDDAATGVLGTSGTPEEGGTLTADVSGLGDVDGGIVSYAYQWQLDGIDISGATDASLAIPDDQSYVGHNVGLVVTTTDGLGGTTTFTSAPQAIANVDDAATGVLGTSGTPEEGGTLTADVSGLGDVDGGIVSYAYQWQLDGIDISGATDASLAIPDDQSYVGHNVGLVVTTTDGLGGTTTFTSAPQAIANVDDAATGVLGTSGTPEEGGTLTADVSGLGDVDGGIVSYAYQWQLDGIDIAGATDASLAIPDDQSYVGHNVGLVVTTTDGLGGTTTFTSAPQAIANVDDAATGVLGTSGTPEEGGTLTADVSGLGDVDGGIVSYAYQWQLDGIDIAGATDASLAIPDDQSYVGHNVGLVVTTTDGLGGTTTFTSAPQAIANVNDAPVSGGPSTATGTEDAASIGNTVPAAFDPDSTPTYALVAGSVKINGVAAPDNTVTFNSNGSYLYVPTAADQALDTGDAKIITFDYIATDGVANSEADTVTITVNGVNDAPVSGGPASASGTEDDASIGGSVPVASDPDDTPTYALVAGSVKINGVAAADNTLTFNANGTYSYTPTLADQDLNTGQSKVITFDYVATDGEANSAPAQVTITVNGITDVPPDTQGPTGINFILNAAAIAPAETGTQLDANTTIGTFVQTGDPNSTVFHYVLGGTNANLFVLNPTTGVLSTGGANIPVSATPYALTITAYDQANNGTTIPVSVYVAGSGKDTITGGSGIDIMFGMNGNDSLNGGDGSDALLGGQNADTLIGGLGADQLVGGGNQDTFLYTSVNESNAAFGIDTIYNFSHGGASADKIDVSAIDAKPLVSGDQAFTFNGTTPTANGIWYTESGGNTILHFDTNGVTTNDEMTIIVVGTGLGLTASDFNL